MGAARVLWINPSGTEFGGTSVEQFAQRVHATAKVTLLGLEIWSRRPGQAYGMATEVAAVTGAAAGERVHLLGFSAGGTVALAAALALGDAVLSVTVLEPAFIGDDDWDAVEAEWRSCHLGFTALPPAERTAAFRQLLMRPGLAPPPPRQPPLWDERDELLERMLRCDTGFVSADLAAIRAPVLAIRGGRSHPRWEAVCRRLVEVCPHTREHVFPGLHHFTPPFRDQPAALASVLLGLWRTP
jgi:pimeloyl-ACP methyl ester carboxylesterase